MTNTEGPQALAFFTETGDDVGGCVERLLTDGLFVPIDGPACGAELDVPANLTNDNVHRHFVCDRAADHVAQGIKHRQVTDHDEGTTIEWADGTATELAHAIRRTYQFGDAGTVTVDLSQLTISALPSESRTKLLAAIGVLREIECGS